MKTSVKAIAVLTALFAGGVIAEAHQPRQRQQQGGPERCPHCSKQDQRRQRLNNFQQQGPRYNQPGPAWQAQQGPRQGPRYNQPGPAWQDQQGPRQRQRQQKPQYRNQRQASEQETHLQRRRERVMERFDRDGDGQLSERERKAMKKALKKRQQAQQDGPEQPAPIPSEE